MKRYTLISVILTLSLLTGCGSPRGAFGLKAGAKLAHGDYTVVSEVHNPDGGWDITLKDNAQGFEYTVKSYMDPQYLDGEEFASFPATQDDFYYCLYDHVISLHSQEIADICSKHGVTYEDFNPNVVLCAPDEASGKAAALEIAEVFKNENVDSRMDGMFVMVVDNTSADWGHNEEYGKVKLPDLVWMTPADEEAQYYIDIAHRQTDRKAVYLRTEEGTLKDTDADFRRVDRYVGYTYEESRDAPVKFYYFRSSKGREYYLCDFNYLDENYENGKCYTNYDSVK
ncbi:MAG: hypothetical protein K6A72_02415 [Lachnospiraceae bacterium]|nr:hypothetical protein [Lachnospiraceae bacterium]